MSIDALNKEVEQLHQRYLESTDKKPLDRLNEDDLDMLILFESRLDSTCSILKEVSNDFAERHGIHQQLTWQKNEIWIKLASPEEGRELKEKLKDMGYTYLETFQGSIREVPERHWVLRCEKKAHPYFGDPKGHSKKLYELMCSIGLNPINTHAYSDIVCADVELTMDNVASIALLIESSKSKGIDVLLSTNVTDAIDVIRVWPLGNAFDNTWLDKKALSMVDCITMLSAIEYNNSAIQPKFIENLR